MNELFSDGFPWWMIWVGFAVFSGMGQKFHRTRRKHLKHKARREAEARVERERRDSAAAWLDQLRRDTAAVMVDHASVNARWLEYELDVAKLIDYPMMSDVREPLT